MTQIAIAHETSPLRHTVPAEQAGAARTAEAVGREPSVGRLVGVDLARALAVFGMFAVHVGPSAEDVGGVGGWLLELAFGRSSVLFATLAGFSLMLIAGQREPKTGLAGRQAKARIAIRAVILLVLGTALTMLETGIMVILAFYAVYFLLALPLVRLRATTLAIIAAGLAVVGPLASLSLTQLLGDTTIESINAYDPIVRLGGDGLLALLLDGFYPTITWMPFVVAGMALGRLDLAAVAVQRRLALFGPALMVLGYGGSWLAMKHVAPLLQAEDTTQQSALEEWAKQVGSASLDTVLGSGSTSADAAVDQLWTGWDPMTLVVYLMSSGPHSGTTFEIIGSLGVAITVLVCATVAMVRLAWLRRLASPLVAVGTMSLTVYVAHIAAYAMLPFDLHSFVSLFAFIAAAILFAAIWSRFFRRGPLEYLLNSTTKLAKFVR